MSLLAELLLQTPPPAPVKRKPGRPKRLLAADIYGPAMRGEGVLSNAELQRRTGRSGYAVTGALSGLVAKGLVRKRIKRAGRQTHFQYEWIGD